MRMFRRLREKKTISNYVVTRIFLLHLQLKEKNSNRKQISHLDLHKQTDRLDQLITSRWLKETHEPWQNVGTSCTFFTKNISWILRELHDLRSLLLVIDLLWLTFCSDFHQRQSLITVNFHFTFFQFIVMILSNSVFNNLFVEKRISLDYSRLC